MARARKRGEQLGVEQIAAAHDRLHEALLEELAGVQRDLRQIRRERALLARAGAPAPRCRW